MLVLAESYTKYILLHFNFLKILSVFDSLSVSKNKKIYKNRFSFSKYSW